MTITEFTESLSKRNIELNERQYEQLAQYCLLLQEWNEKINLTAITEMEEVYEKHFLDSILPLNKQIQGKVIDVGTGAGFPGLVWKIVRPDLKVTLLEPTMKRVNFLNKVIDRLQLEGIETVNKRAEDYAKEQREQFDVVTARAVANLPVLSELCLPLVKENGWFIAMKGDKGVEEVREAKKAIETLGGKLVDYGKEELNGMLRCNIVIQKIKKTPNKYPRPYSQIKRSPL